MKVVTVQVRNDVSYLLVSSLLLSNFILFHLISSSYLYNINHNNDLHHSPDRYPSMRGNRRSAAALLDTAGFLKSSSAVSTARPPVMTADALISTLIIAEETKDVHTDTSGVAWSSSALDNCSPLRSVISKKNDNNASKQHPTG